MKKIILILIFSLCATFASAAENMPDAEFASANSAYRQGKYQNAIDQYEQILRTGVESPTLYYNLGNSYYKNKQLGKALVNYERAKKILPRDRDLTGNYNFANGAVIPRVDSRLTFVEKAFQTHIHFYSINEMVLIISLMIVILVGLHLGGLYFFWKFSRPLMVVFSIFIVIFMVGVVVKLNAEKNASIIIKATAARFEPHDKATAYFDLPQGQRVRWQIKEGEWLRVERPDGKVGWVPAETLEII